jgi:hypothetical protein
VVFLQIFHLGDGCDCVIRKVSERDAAELVRYSNIVGGESDFLSYGIDEFNHSIEQQRQIIREYNDAPNRLFIIAVVDGCICGNLTFWGNNRKRLEHWGEVGISVLKKYCRNSI